MASASNPQESTVEPHAALSTHLPGPKLWRCTLCNREMQSVSKADHLAGKAHARELKLSHASSTVVSGTTVVHKTPSKKRQTANNTKNPQQKSWTCPSCHAVVSLKQKASHPCSFIPKSSTAGIDGPLDNFFHSYPSFHYNASTPPSTSFNSLRTHLTKRHRWPPKCREHDELWEQYQDALTEEFNLLFGVQNDLDAWHSLCRAVRIDPLPTTCKDCRSSVRGRHVNIIDLIEWGRSGGKYVQIFRTVKDLSNYSFGSDKIFSKRARNELKAGAVLKHLLRELQAA